MYSDAKITHYFLYRQGNTNKNGFPAVVRQDKGGALSKYRGLSRESTGFIRHIRKSLKNLAYSIISCIFAPN